VKPFTDNGWLTVVTIVPTALVTAGVVLIAVLTLAARSPETRGHHLAVLAALTDFVRALRTRR
jgi:hypothetical protein